MKENLTDRTLRRLMKAKPAAVAIGDIEVRQLQVRAGVDGTVTFSVLKRPPGSRKLARFPVGAYPLISLAEARSKARDILREIGNGSDPRIRRAEELKAAAATKAHTFASVAEAFIARHVVSKRSARTIEQRIRRELIPRWATRPISDIKRADVISLLDEIVDRGHPGAAHLTLSYTRRLFSWALPRYELEHSPCDHISGVDLIGVRPSRKRVLSDSEIALVWRATEGVVAVGSYVRLLLLLGARRRELGDATWSEFDLDKGTWVVPAGRMKTDEAHSIPLPPLAVDILRKLLLSGLLPRPGARVFGATHNYDRLKRALDARVKALNGGKALPRFTLHDLRRTMRTGLSTIGIAPHIAELCIAHRQRGIVQVYDLHRFDDEKRAALEAWAERVMSIVSPHPPTDDNKVVRLRKTA